MATSGQSTLTTTRNQIIRKAALKVKAVGQGMTMTSAMIDDFALELNAMVKRWQADGIHIWTVTEATLFPQPEQTRYALGTGSTDHCTKTWHSTELSADEASGQTVLSVASNSDMVNGDKIGIILDDGTFHWTTIVSSTSGSVTITAALPDSASEGAKVFFYTSDIVRPIKVVDGRRYNISDTAETPVMMVARRDYQGIPLKQNGGSINQAFYDRQLNVGYLHLWGVPPAATELFKFTWHRPIETFEAAGDNPDLPEEWMQCLWYNLAKAVLPDFEVPAVQAREIKEQAAEYLDSMRGFDREDEAIFVQPALDG